MGYDVSTPFTRRYTGQFYKQPAPFVSQMIQHPPSVASDPPPTTLLLPLTLLRQVSGPAIPKRPSTTVLEPAWPPKPNTYALSVAPPFPLSTPHIIDPDTYRIQQAQLGNPSPSLSTLAVNFTRKLAPESPKSDNDRDTVELSVGGKTLHIGAHEVLDIFGSASNSLVAEGEFWQQQGVLSYVAFTKGDPYIMMVRAYIIDLFRSESFTRYIKSNVEPSAGVRHTKGTTDMLSGAFKRPGDNKNGKFEEERTIVNENALIVTKIKHKDDVKDEASNGALFFELQQLMAVNSPKLDYFKLAQRSILRILPRAGAAKLAILRFFLYVHPFVPIFHEETIMSEFESILTDSGSPDEPYSSIEITDESQLSMAAQLVLMIRLGYMSLIPNVEMKSAFTHDQKVLITDITRFKSDEYLTAINLCLSADKIHSRSSFKHVQGLTLLHYYRSVAPNDGLGLSGSDSCILLGSIVTHALSIGLNRDPTKFEAIELISKRASFVETWRSLWHYICEIDAVIAMNCGTSLKIPNLDISDVEIPKLHSSKYAKFFQGQAKIHNFYRNISKLVGNVRRKPRIVEILREVSKIETEFLKIFEKDFFLEVICQPAVINLPTAEVDKATKFHEASMKVIMFNNFIQISSNLWCLYYMITVHYEKIIEEEKTADISAGIELFEMFFQRALQLVYILSYSFDKSHELFGLPYDFMVTAQIERCMIKSHVFLSSFFFRLLCHREKLGNEKAREEQDYEIAMAAKLRREVVESLFHVVMQESELFVGTFRKMGKTYLSSYRLHTMVKFVLEQCKEHPEKLFARLMNNKDLIQEGANLVNFLSTSAIIALLRLCREFKVAKQEQSKRLSKAYSVCDVDVGTAVITPGFPSDEPDTSPIGEYDDRIIRDKLDSLFDATSANREMYSLSDFSNPYSRLQEGVRLDNLDMNMGYEEMLRVFTSYSDFDFLMISEL